MLREMFKGIIDIAYPHLCLVCKNRLKGQTPDNPLCPECRQKIKRNVPPFCYCCGRHLERNNLSKNICPVCVRKKMHFDRAFSPYAYEGVIKELVHQFKYKNKDYLDKALSAFMINFIKEYNLPVDYIDYILPVPLHKNRLREREFNQAELLGKRIAEEFNKKLAGETLLRHVNTKTQTELDMRERMENVRGSFSVKDAALVKGKNLLLVDDVFTTGSTASECALALKNSGAGIVFVLTLAN